MCFVAVEVVDFAHAIARVVKRKEIGAGKSATFGTALPFFLSLFFPPVGAGLLLRWFVTVATVGLWLQQASHKASVALTIIMAVLWFPAPTPYYMEGGQWIKNMERKRSTSVNPVFSCNKN